MEMQEVVSTVILLGYRQGVVSSLTEKGYRIIYVVDAFSSVLNGKEYYLLKNIEDAQEVLRCILSLSLHRVAGVVAAGENAVFTAALLRVLLNVQGPRNYAGYLSFRDKFLQKNKLSGVVPHAGCKYASRRSDYLNLMDEFGDSFILKPSNGSGGEGVAEINSRSEFDNYFDTYGKEYDSLAYVVEKKVVASELCVDGIWFNGKLQWLSVSQYISSPLKFNDEEKFEVVIILSRNDFKDTYHQMESFCHRTLKKLNASNGVFHLKVFKEGEGMIFGGCKLGPVGVLIPEIIRLAYGIDLYEAHAMFSLGLSYERAMPQYPSMIFSAVKLPFYYSGPLGEECFKNDVYFTELGGEVECARSKPHGRYGFCSYAIISVREPGSLMEDIEVIVGHDLRSSG
ncbi:ATP-grasp domain-containing protein [Serratia marcescens]|uniref:ATP-grasp domain-containing protein n=1 Tax=Serratia marcescens TaxID=615 RepID=UPI00313E03FA